jgi:hypothetical protein
MTITSDQKIEITKIIIGVVISIVGALWTYSTYTENERNNELDTLIGLGNAIAGMHVTCKGGFGKLADLASEDKNSRKGRCYAYFQDAHRISLAAVITVKKPYLMSTKEWVGYWGALQDVIAAAGSESYEFNTIEDAWVEILVAKALKEKTKGKMDGV